MAPVKPGAVKARLPAQPPDAPESMQAIMRDLQEVILPGLTHWQHPQFFGYFPSNGALASVLGDYVSTGLGVLGLAWQSSPALSELEEVATSWLRQMVGLSEQWEGVIQDTASTCTLLALLSARERATDYGANRGGLQSEAQPLVVYTSAHAPQLRGQGGAAGRLRPRQHPPRAARRRVRDVARRRSRRRFCDDRRRGLAALCRDAHDRNHDDDGAGSRGGGRRRGTALRPLGACRCRHGRVGHGAARVPVDVGGRRGGRLGGAQPAQMAGRSLRLLGVLRKDAEHLVRVMSHQPQLPAVVRGRPREELPRLGHPARPAVPRAEAVVPHPRAGGGGAAGAAAP